MKKLLFFVFLLLFPAVFYGQGEIITTIIEEFKGKLFLYEDKDEAISGLKSTLAERMEKRLKGMGFGDNYIPLLLKKSRYSGIEVVEKRVEILKDNKKVKTKAYDISGYISVALDETDIIELGENLKRVSPISEEEKTFYKEALKNFLTLGARVKNLDVSFLKLKLSEIIKADIIKQIQVISGREYTSFKVLQDMVHDILNVIENNVHYLNSKEDVVEITNNLLTNIEYYYKRSIIDIATYEGAIECAKNISKMVPNKKEEALNNLMFIIEFKWAENIQNSISNSNVEISRIHSEVEGFLNNFKGSKFIKNIKNRLLSRLTTELQDEHLGYDIFQYILLLYERLYLSELKNDMINKCETILENVESPSDEISKNIEQSFDICIKHADPNTKRRLIVLREKFRRSEKNRVYKNMLGNLAFIMRFIRYSDAIPFGSSREGVESSRFGDFLNESSITTGCSCLSGDDEECRVFVYAGDQFEVVLRYNNKKLYEIGVCNLNMKGKSSVVLSYLKENFKPLFKKDTSQVEDNDGVFDYELKRNTIVSLEKIGFLGNLFIFDKSLKPKGKPQISYTYTQGLESYKIGDCVEWDCEVECRYKGRVEKLMSDNIVVVITSAPKASELNMRKKVQKSIIKKCQSF